jgi:hypothetical protein
MVRRTDSVTAAVPIRDRMTNRIVDGGVATCEAAV